jgi:hypothetical protein
VITRTGRLLAAGGVAVLAALATLTGAVPAGAAPAPQPVFRLHDQRLDELSGIAVGIRSPGVFYAQNDSGDSARFFALDARTGDVRAVYDVPGATNHDWEDLAVADDAAGVPSVWLGDIGDNDGVRSSIQLYRVDEPAVPRSGGATLTTARPQVWSLRYPDGAHNAETLLVTPTGRAYIVTKDLTGESQLYEVPARPSPGHTQTLGLLGNVDFHLTGSPGPFGPIGELTATGGAVSRDGTRVVIRTYSDAYLWTVPRAGIAAALQAKPVVRALPEQHQGEGICFDGDQLVTDSEGVGSAVYRLPVPAIPPQPAGGPAASTASAASGAPSSRPSTAPGTAPASADGAAGSTGPRWAFVALLGIAAVVVATVIVVPLRIRRTGRRAGSRS